MIQIKDVKRTNFQSAAAELAEVVGLEDEEQIQGQKFEWKDNLSKLSECKELMQKQREGALKFIAHHKHTIKGKAQLINQNMQQITFMTRVWKEIPVEGGMRGEKTIVSEVKVFGDSIDKRTEEVDKILSEYAWIYRVISESKEYTLLSFKELGNEVYTFHGMNIRMSMPTEVSKMLSLKGFANIFICYEAEPAIRVLSKEKLVELTKKTKYSVSDFMDFNFYHPSGKIFYQPGPYMALRAVQLLGGKYEGYPLHTMTMGIAGTGKTMEVESLNYKFKELSGILEAANSRHKAIVPSFKENPAQPGYVLSCIRTAIIDELMKMVEAAAVGTRQEQQLQNLLTQMNMLLEHKLRTIGSGNANFMKCQATAKVCIFTNPLTYKRTLADHTSLIDITLLSRMLPYIQDAQHLYFLASQKSGTTQEVYNKNNGATYKVYNNNLEEKEKGKKWVTPIIPQYSLCCTTNLIDDNDYLSIIDSANSFLIMPDLAKIRPIYQTALNLLQNPTLRQIFSPRGIHHLVCMFDGLVKLRCLFRDYDPTFTPIEEDYQELEKLILYVVSTWTTDFSEVEGII